MGIVDIYMTKAEYSFAGLEGGEGLVYVIGVPFDSTSSFRSGQRRGPAAVRRASANIESNGYVNSEVYIENVGVIDLGDVGVVHGDVRETLHRVERVAEELGGEGKLLAAIGGEHTITLGLLRGLASKNGAPCVIVLDAHFDLRDEYLGLKLSHATVFRRALEEGVAERVFYLGVRAWDPGELEYAKSSDRVDWVTSRMLQLSGVANAVAHARHFTSRCESIYLSIDIDFLDPAYAPGAANPEPGGATIWDLLEAVAGLASDNRLIGVDVVEVAPQYDCGEATSIAAAKALQEAILAYYNARRKPG